MEEDVSDESEEMDVENKKETNYEVQATTYEHKKSEINK